MALLASLFLRLAAPLALPPAAPLFFASSVVRTGFRFSGFPFGFAISPPLSDGKIQASHENS